MADFTVGKYLAARFEQIGLKHYFMVPGDYNLVLLDELLSNENLTQIGCCNELNAAYAAEGYARANGAGAVLTTYNVGAYSALNGVAGAYAERLPVIFVSSGPNTNDPAANHIMHHTMGTHDFTDQYAVCRQVTCEAVRILHPDNAPTLIDQAISTALRERKPAYIEVACNLSAAPCPEPAPIDTLLASTMLSWQPTSARALTVALGRASELIDDAKKPILLAGAHLRSYGAIDAFRELAEALGCAVAVMPNAKGFFPEDHPQYVGIYWGEVSTPQCQAIVDWADLILAAGPVFSDYTTVGWTAQPPRQKLISAEPQVVRFAAAEYTGVSLADFLSDLAKKVRANDATLVQYQRLRQSVSAPAPAPAEAPLSRAELWRQIEADLDAKTTLMVETGISWWDGVYTRLPGGARFEIEMQWGSIGWCVPAAFGYSLGLETDRRLVAAIGDGSFQLTAQEVSNMIRHGQQILIFLINNRGYVIESAVHDGPYNYYKNWDYAGLIDVFNADDGHGLGLTARTPAELAEAIGKAHAHKGGPVLIECQIPNDDASPQVISWGIQSRPSQRPPTPTHLGETAMTDQVIGAHNDLHSEQGALKGEHAGRSANPIIKVQDVIWLEFEKPDLERAEAFAQAFGFSTALRTDEELHLRGCNAGAPCVLIRRGEREKFLGPAFVAAEHSDLVRLADATGATVRPLPESLGGVTVDLVDPSGLSVRVVSGTHGLEALPAQTPHVFNFGHEVARANATQRPPRVPTTVQRLGHIVVQTPKYIEALNWYLDHLGLIVSDFCFYPGQRERGPIMSFIRCDRGSKPADHHTLAMALGPVNRYVHSAYQVADLDALAAGGEYLREQGYFRSWGIGRHIQGSQIFDYWRDPDGFLVEHFADGDMFDNTLEPGWAPLSASGLYQWGPPPSRDFLGVGSPRATAAELAAMVDALRHDNEFDLSALRGLFNVANS